MPMLMPRWMRCTKRHWFRTDNQIQNMTMAAMLSAAIKVHALIVGWSERFRSSQRRRVEAMLCRLNSELRHGHKGFSVLVPRRLEGRPMAITLVYGKEDCVSTPALFETVRLAMRACLPDPETLVHAAIFGPGSSGRPILPSIARPDLEPDGSSAVCVRLLKRAPSHECLSD